MAFPVHQIAYAYRTDAEVPAFADDRPIIVYDGDCAISSRWVQFALRHDKRQRYRFLAAQSALGTAMYRHYGLSTDDYGSNILMEDGIARFKADGSLRMIAGLGLPWSLVRLLRAFPLPWLDRAYSLVARNRIRWFGRPDQCLLPNPDQASRFLS